MEYDAEKIQQRTVLKMKCKYEGEFFEMSFIGFDKNTSFLYENQSYPIYNMC